MLIPNGTFQMGLPIEEEKAANDEWQHQVTISKDYYLGVMEVTQGQYAKVMRTNLSHFQKRVICKSDSSMYPVETVSWEDAVEFCNKLSDLPEEMKADLSPWRELHRNDPTFMDPPWRPSAIDPVPSMPFCSGGTDALI